MSIALHCTKRVRQQAWNIYLFFFYLLPTLTSSPLSSQPLSRQLGIHLSINLISASSKPRPDRRTQTPTPDPSESKQKKYDKKRQNSSLIKRPPPLPPPHPHLKRTASSSPDASHPPSSPPPHPTGSTPQSWSARAPAAPCGESGPGGDGCACPRARSGRGRRRASTRRAWSRPRAGSGRKSR